MGNSINFQQVILKLFAKTYIFDTVLAGYYSKPNKSSNKTSL